MNKTSARHIIIGSVIVAAVAAIGFMYASSNTYRKEITMSNEKELKATLDAGLATLTIARGTSSLVFNAEVETDKNTDVTNEVEYSVRDRVGYLTLNTEEREGRHEHSFHISNLENSRWNTYFTDAVPISFDVELGLGRGDFDFSGLTVKDLNLSAGASSVNVRFDTPNKSTIQNLNIEAGLSKFHAQGLGNANFNHLRFEGGVGAYTLDFSGRIEREVDADIEVGLGSLTISIPEDVGAKIFYEKSFIAHLDLERNFTEQQGDTYISPNYYSAKGKINLHIQAGAGSVKIR